MSQAAAVASAFQAAAAPEAAGEDRSNGFAALLMRGRYGAFGQRAFAWLSGKFDMLSGSSSGSRSSRSSRASRGSGRFEV